MNQGDLHKVWEIKALKRKPRADEAQKILERISKHVQPIMRKRKWRVKLLSEFCSKNLLGLNVGAGIHVKLRLRASNELNFIPFEQVLDTMLHELCHNVHGPHNANFYSLWDELRKECEELTSKGIIGTGEGFDLPGRRLGGISRQPPLSSLRKTAVAAVEKRTRLNSLLPSGPKRLGGDSSVMSALSPLQAAAMAAERRYQDNMWCASEFPEMFNIEEEEGEDYFEPPVLKPALETQTTTTSCHAESSKTGHKRSDVSSSQSCKKRHVEFIDLSYETPVSMWECGTCTLLNPPLAPVCKICGSEKAKDLKEWSCKFCTMENSVKIDICTACEQWRYSHGPPVSTSVIAGHWS